MSQERISQKQVVYPTRASTRVNVRRDIDYSADSGGTRTMDLYSKPDATNHSRTPAVVIVAGFPDVGYRKVMGCRFKDTGSSVSWGRLLASLGMAVVTYSNQDPVVDAAELLGYLRRNSAQLNIDKDRIGLWACSGNVPLALSLLMQPQSEYLKCAAFLYGYMLDQPGTAIVADAARSWKFANPSEGRALEDLPSETPLMLVRAGRDEMPGLNQTIDAFVAGAVARNLPLTLVNQHDAPHALDLWHEGRTTRSTIRQVMSFMESHLLDVDADGKGSDR